MPRGQPFTALCQAAARVARPVNADLHTHTTASDGDFTPSQVVAFARGAGLAAVAITDHDTLDSVEPARQTAQELNETGFASTKIEVIAGVEISTSFEEQELHLLGLFVNSPSKTLTEALAHLADERRIRFHRFVEAIRALGHDLDPATIVATEAVSVSLGRRHVSRLMVRSGIAATHADAWRRFVGPIGPTLPPRVLLPIDRAIELLRESGAVAGLAHPPESLEDHDFARLAEYGLQALEVRFPAAGVGRTTRLQAIAKQYNWQICGGSDCHGGDEIQRKIGSRGISTEELERLRELAS